MAEALVTFSSRSDKFDNIQDLEAETNVNTNLQLCPENPKSSDVNLESDSIEDEIFYDTVVSIGEYSKSSHLTEPIRNVDSEDNDKSSEEKNNEDHYVGYNLSPEFLQRSPSHITIKSLTLPRARCKTYPNLEKDFNEAKKKQKSNFTSQKSTPAHSNFSESLHPKTEATSISAMQRGGQKNVSFELDNSQIIGAMTGYGKTEPYSSKVKGAITKHTKEEPDSSQFKDAINECAKEELDNLQVTNGITENANEKSDSPQITGAINEHDEAIASVKSIDEVDSNETQEKDSDINESGVCMECVQAIEIISRDEIKPGDHITFSGRVYDHHAIVINVQDFKEDDMSKIHIEIVHATNTSAKATFASLHPFGNKARLKQVSEIVNLKEKKMMVYKYSSSMKPFSPSDIVKRAKAEAEADRQGGQGQFKYNLFRNNCEHFATWCVTGRKLSLQVRKFSMVFWMFLKSGFYGISDEFLRNEKEYEKGMLCQSCYLRNKKLLKIAKTTIFDADQVKAGDIITYSYYFLWHSAVVLEILNKADNYVESEIAHYAYLGPFKHREIRKEKLIIPLNGSVFLTIYPKNFDVYTTEEVLERARSRIGEQMFAFFSNDSSQFSRWCKLKLQKQAN